METSSIITIVYFSFQLLLLLVLAVYIYKTGKHYEGKSFLKDVWAQRKIYAPILIHFYDTATDLGVVWYWYTLKQNEDNGTDYESLDMTVMFWCGLAFLILYRVILFGVLGQMVEAGGREYVSWYDPYLAIFHLYVFKTVYLSFVEAQDVIQENILKRQQCQQNITGITAAGATTNSATTQAVDSEEKEIQVHGYQLVALMTESVTESLPQIMLQSVFIIKSYNDPQLRDTNIWLLLFSVLASLLSINDKFIKLDNDIFTNEDEKLSTKMKFSSFSDGLCFNKQSLCFFLHILWRLCNVTSNFIVYVLIWTVMGGAWLPIWGCILFISHYVIAWKVLRQRDILDASIPAICNMVGTAVFDPYLIDRFYRLIRFKWCFVLAGLMMITVFATAEFECGICADSEHRHFDNADESGVTNYRILIFYLIGCASLVMEIRLYYVLKNWDIFKLF